MGAVGEPEGEAGEGGEGGKCRDWGRGLTGEGDVAGNFFGRRDWGVVVGHLCASERDGAVSVKVWY